MFDLESAIQFAEMEVSHTMPSTYDVIRQAIQNGKRSVKVSVGECYSGSGCCKGRISELHLDRLIRDKYIVKRIEGMHGFGGTVTGHYEISGWSQTKRRRIRGIPSASE